MTLFDLGTRTETRVKGHSEPEFTYLNQSARPSVYALRGILEEWFQHFPRAAQTDLRSRFRDSSNSQHYGAFFELYVHELLIRAGYAVVVHPVLDNVNTRPDFLARNPNGAEFYVEVTLAGIPAQAAQGADTRIAQVYDILDRMDSPNFFLHLDVEGSPASPPPASKLRGQLQRWLATLDPDEISRKMQIDGFDSIPKFTWRHSGWEIVITPIAKSVEARGKSGIRPIGAVSPEAQWLQTDADLKAALEVKANKYGEFEIPLLIAVNVLSVHCDDIDILNGLFGQEGIVCSLAQDGSIVEQSQTRKRNGFWYGPKGARNQTASGALIVSNLNEWSMGVLTPELFHNPWAKCILNSDWWPMPQRIPDNKTGYYSKHNGKTASEVLSIPAPWPLTWD
ncbi:MAG: hypothetical protein LAO78_17545 [Acidobacteriia bacterium]|nr:hypothetical protein [Terriglobia bacterium]